MPVRIVYHLLRNLLVLPFVPLLWLLRFLTRPRAAWLRVRLRSDLVELERPRSRVLSALQFRGQPKRTSVWELRRFAQQVQCDPAVTGIVVEVPLLHAGWATISGVRDVLTQLVAAGKQVVVWLPQGGGNRELHLSTAASRVLVTPQASFGPLGLAAGVRYYKSMLDKIGVELEVEARREFKTVAEPATRTEMSEAQREQLGALLNTIDGALRAGLASRPGMDEDRVAAVFEATFLRGQAAVDAGIADGLAYDDQLAEEVSGEKGADAVLGSGSEYFGWHEARFFVPLRRPKYVAVVQIHGPIVTTAPNNLLAQQRRTAATETVVGALRRAGKDQRAVGVLLHVDSPGGSALASDLIHQEVAALRRSKPVVAWFGEVAASGGYYVAACADRIIGPALGITGSIGVVMAKVVLQNLYEKLGIRVETLRLGPHADILSGARKLTEAERDILAREADGFYDAFVDVVAAGRGKESDVIEPLARGRVWSVRDAVEHGLVDALGGFDRAVAEVLNRAEVPQAEQASLQPRVVMPPKERLAPPAPEVIDALIGGPFAELGGLALALGDERALYYATGLPIIR